MNMGAYPQSQQPATPPPAAPPSAAAPPKRSKIWVGAMVMMLLSVVFLGMAMVMPFYTTETSADGDIESRQNWNHEGLETETSERTTTLSWDDELRDWKATKGVFDLFYYMVIGGLVVALLAMIFVILAGIGKMKPILPVILILVAFILTMMGPLLFMAMLPDAWVTDCEDMCPEGIDCECEKQDFMGSEKDEDFGTETTFGPGLGWYMAIIAMVIQLVGLILMLVAAKKIKAQAQEAPPSQPPAGAPPAQGPPGYGAPPPQDPYGGGGYGQPPQQGPPQYPQY